MEVRFANKIGLWSKKDVMLMQNIFLQNKATTGKQGLGIKDRPRKIAGCHFLGKKTSFSDSDETDVDDTTNISISAKRKYDEIIETEKNDEPKVKLKKLCRRLLRQVSCPNILSFYNHFTFLFLANSLLVSGTWGVDKVEKTQSSY